MSSRLHELADTIGILTQYNNDMVCACPQLIDDNILVAMAETLGYKAGSEEEIEHSIDMARKRRWLNTLDSIYVVEQENIWFDVVLPPSKLENKITLSLKYADTAAEFTPAWEVYPSEEEYQIGRTVYHKQIIKITDRLEVGYYELLLQVGSEKFKSRLAVAPQHCYSNEAIEQGKLWGYAIQLYSLRSERNWGIGDFTDLANLVDVCKNSGADIIGLNPINVLSHDYPEEASPYGSISRLFLNPIYIDVEAVPEYNSSDAAEFQAEIAELRKSELIQYGRVYPLKIRVLEKLYDRFRNDPESNRWAEFEKYSKSKGADLERLAAFQAMSEEWSGKVWGGWKAWGEEYRNPGSLAVSEFVQNHIVRIGFFKYLQFEAERQFNLVGQRIAERQLKVGLYRDLAVGVGQNSAELWGDYDAYIKEAGAGAPPDEFFCNGQNWGLGAFNPYVLKDRAYEPYIKVLRANMQNAGALRIDHAMSLMRLFIVLNRKERGTYVLYNFEDMLNILAIESYLNKCVIVGESIGVVPEGFIERLESKNISSLSVLWAERWYGAGDFKSPYDYPAKAFASVGTHDMPPLKMWWFGTDIEEKFQLGVIPDENCRNLSYKQRELDRSKLLFTLDSNGVWPEDKPRQGDYLYGEGYPEGIEEAVHRYIARARSEAVLIQPEDILHVEKMQNLPGVDRDKHPNWRRKLPVSLDNLEADIAFIRNIAAIHKERS